MALGWPSVEWGLAHISSRELTEWIAYYESVEPFGSERADYAIAITSSVIANANRDKKKRNKPYSANEFMPDFKPKRQKSVDEMIGVAQMITSAYDEKEDVNDSTP